MLGRELFGVGIRERKGIPPELSGGAELETWMPGSWNKELCLTPYSGKQATDIAGKQQNSANLA